MENPFEIILERLDRIEKTIDNLSANGPLSHTNDPMDIKALSAYIKTSPSAIYKFTAYSDETVHPIPGQTEQLFL